VCEVQTPQSDVRDAQLVSKGAAGKVTASLSYWLNVFTHGIGSVLLSVFLVAARPVVDDDVMTSGAV